MRSLFHRSQILIGKDLDRVSYDEEEEAYYVADAADAGTRVKLMGLVHCTYMAPQHLEMPLLYHIRKSDDAVVFASCKSCADGMRQKYCAHRVETSIRMTAVICSAELSYARKLDYRLVAGACKDCSFAGCEIYM